MNRQMKKQLAMTSAMAAVLIAVPACTANDGWDEDVYASRDTAICVDRQGERVDDDLCDDDGYRGGGSSAFLWYYMGRGSRLPYYGDSIHHRRYQGHGSFRPGPGISYDRAPKTASMTRSQAVSRGGFGSSSRRYGGGWS